MNFDKNSMIKPEVKKTHLLKYSIGVLIVLLSTSLTMNIMQASSAAHRIPSETNEISSVLNETHEIHKSIEQGTVTWTEMITKAIDASPSNMYELWRINTGDTPTLVATFARNQFSNLDWSINNNLGIDVTYWTGGSEGGTSTKIIYDALGEELVRVTQNKPEDWDFKYKIPQGPEYVISYLSNETCKNYTSQPENDASPIIEVQGLTITYGNEKKQDYFLKKPISVVCRQQYDQFVNPAIEIVDFDENRVRAKLPNDTIATVAKAYNAYGTLIEPAVLFSEE